MNVTIDRKHWWRGHGQGEEHNSMSMLLGDGRNVPEDQMCCLGHVSLACGLTKDQIRGKDTPLAAARHDQGLTDKLKGLIEETYYGMAVHTGACRSMMIVNDDTTTTDEYKETTLTNLGLKAGFNLTFV